MSDTFDLSRVTWVLDPRALDRLIAALEDTHEVSWDLETTGLNEWDPDAKIVLASFTIPVRGSTTEADTWLLPLYHPESPFLGSWRAVYRRAALAMVGKYLEAHNGKFDCRWTYRHTGVDLSTSLMWDSQISSHGFDENRSNKLKDRAPEEFGMKRWDDDVDLKTPGAALRIPLITLGFYAARDTYWAWRLCVNHRIRMYAHESVAGEEPMSEDEVEDARLGLLSRFATMPTVRTLTQIEQRGFLLDGDWVREAIAERVAIRDEEREWLVGLVPLEDQEHDHLLPEEDFIPVKDCPGCRLHPSKASFAPTSHWFKAWTEEMVRRGDLKVTSTTKKGNAQWNKAVLIRQERAGSEVARRLLRYRGAVKQLEFLNAWVGYQREDGAIHAHYNVGSLITGRLSSSEPNMQQVTKILRPAFIARPGYVLADFDYSQIELRVAAFISRCAPMIAAFQRGDDLHTMLAGKITNKQSNLALVTPEERQAGKSANFGLLYQMSAYGFRMYAETVYDVSFTREEAEDIHRAFFEMWTGMREWHSRAISRAHATGQVVSPIGRVRRVPKIFSSDPASVSYAERAAINAPVQGFASDIMQIAAALIAGTLPGSTPVEDAHLVATVHDSIVAELPADRWEEVARECVDRMERGVLEVLRRLGCDFDVPLVAEVSVGTRWSLKDVGEIV